MEDPIYVIPDDFIEGEKGELNLHFYTSEKSSEKNKVSFTQNLLSFLLAGNKHVIGNSQSLHFDASKLMLLREGNVLMTEKTNHQGKYQSLLLFFSTDLLFDTVTQYNLDQQVTSKEKSNVISLNKDPYILNFEKSLLLLDDQKSKNRYLAQSKFQEIVLYLVEAYPGKMLPFIHNSILKKEHLGFKEVIHTHLNDNLTNKELAFLCNMSLSTFKRKFAEIYQTTPNKYAREQRMKKAATLLRNNRRPSEIWFELGYESLSSFSNEFKKYFGTPPSTYEHTSKLNL